MQQATHVADQMPVQKIPQRSTPIPGRQAGGRAKQLDAAATALIKELPAPRRLLQVPVGRGLHGEMEPGIPHALLGPVRQVGPAILACDGDGDVAIRCRGLLHRGPMIHQGIEDRTPIARQGRAAAEPLTPQAEFNQFMARISRSS